MSPRLPVAPTNVGALRLLGATLIDGTGSDPVEDAEVEVVDGRIAYAGRRRGAYTARTETIDAAGLWVMPGFIDAHVHLVMAPEPTETQRTWFPEQGVIGALDNLRATVEAGVTTARDLSGLTPGYRHAVGRGQVIGPRLHLAIAMLSPTGGHADPVRANGSLPLWAEQASTPGWAVVDTAEDVIRAVRALVRTGADLIKVCTSGGLSSPHDDPEDTGLSEDQVRLIVEELRGRGGRPVTAHAQTDAAVHAAVAAGAASVEHGYEMSDDTIALMMQRETVLVPTLSTLLRLPDRGQSEDAAARQALQRRAEDSIRRAVHAGVRVALGTDAGIHPHGKNLTELAHLVHVGLSPLEAIQAGTLNGARLLGLERDIGSIEEGKLADLIVVDANPLADISALADPATVVMVLQGGRAVKDVERRALLRGRTP